MNKEEIQKAIDEGIEKKFTELRQASVYAPSGGATVDTEARDTINKLIIRLKEAGIIL